MGTGWQIFSALTNGIAKASTAIGGQIELAITNRGAIGARSGILGPGDPPPPPNSGDIYDYRGLISARQLRNAAGVFPLGYAIEPRRGAVSPIGIPAKVLEQHAAIIGPTGAGKTSSLVVPWIAGALRDGHSVIAVDVTGNLFDKIQEYAQNTGPLGARVAVWDFTRPANSVNWNWLEDLTTEDAVVAAVEALIGRDRPGDPQPYFMQRDKRVLRGLIEGVLATASPSLDTLLMSASDQSLLRRLATLRPSIGNRLAEVASLPASDFGRAMSGVVNALDIFGHAGVRAVTRGGGITLGSLTDAPSLLVIGAPLSGSRTSVSLSSLMIAMLTRQLYTRFGQHSARRVFYFIDEAARLTDRIDFEELLSVSRAAGISVVLAAQNVAQFADKNERATILDNCATYVTLPTPSDESASYFASRLGTREVSTLTESRTVGGFNATSSTQYSRSLSTVPVLGKREIMNPPWGERSAIVHCLPLAGAPFAVDLTRPDLLTP
jgi:type IV secretory pathway TraG/TraD family ATPase VirD4